LSDQKRTHVPVVFQHITFSQVKKGEKKTGKTRHAAPATPYGRSTAEKKLQFFLDRFLDQLHALLARFGVESPSVHKRKGTYPAQVAVVKAVRFHDGRFRVLPFNVIEGQQHDAVAVANFHKHDSESDGNRILSRYQK
jgi:hypothetical protein